MKNINDPYVLNYKKLWIALGWLQVISIIILSLIPNPPVAMIKISYMDKIGHFSAYGILMLWFCQIYPLIKQRLQFAILFILMGIFLEYIQGLSGVRMYEVNDMVANSSGIAIGILLAYLGLNKILHRLELFIIK